MSVPEISVAELLTRLTDGLAVFDVRETDEYTDGHVPGAVHIPLGEVTDRVTEFPTDVEFAVICQAGGRSMRAAQFLVSQGRTCVNVAGGTGAWRKAGYEVVLGSDPA